MPERARSTEALRAAAPIRVGDVTLVAIERIATCVAGIGAVAFASVALEPYAVVVRDGGGVRVVGVGAAAVTLEELRREVPGLDAIAGLLGPPPSAPAA